MRITSSSASQRLATDGAGRLGRPRWTTGARSGAGDAKRSQTTRPEDAQQVSGKVPEMHSGATSRWPLNERLFGGVLLSHILSGAVPLALAGLTSGFGMGPGVSLPLWPP